MIKPRIVFVGTGLFAVDILKGLLKNYELLLIITQPAKSTNKKKRTMESPVGNMAKELNLPTEKPLKIENINEEILSLKPDILVVADYGQIIPKTTLNIARCGSVNIHPSLLPKFRGPSPIQATIISGDKITGTSLMVMDEKMDHGPIIAQSNIILKGNENTNELEKRLAEDGINLLHKFLELYLIGEVTPKEQDHDKASFCKILSREDGQINFNESVILTERKIRAYKDWPGCWFLYTFNNQPRRVKLLDVNIRTDIISNVMVGKLFYHNNNLGLKFVDGWLQIIRLQIEGKNVTTGEAFYHGYQKNIIKTA